MAVSRELARLYREYYANRLSLADYRYQRGLLLDSLVVTDVEPADQDTVSRDEATTTEVAPEPEPEPLEASRGTRWPAVAAVIIVLFGGTVYLMTTQVEESEETASTPVESEPPPSVSSPVEEVPEQLDYYIEPDVGQLLVEAFLARDNWTTESLLELQESWGGLPTQDRVFAKGTEWFAPLADRLGYEIDEAAEFSDAPGSDQRLQHLYAVALELGLTELAPDNWKPGLAARSVPLVETRLDAVDEQVSPEPEPELEPELELEPEPVAEETAAAPVMKIEHEEACSAEQLQTRRRSCFDLLVSGGQGPAMRVISAGSVVGVTVDAPFAISASEISSAQYADFCGQSGAVCPDDPWPGENMPAVNVSWNDAVAYCDWLSDETGYRYRLPTDAEWEYAARAGSTSDYPFGDEITAGQARYSSIATYDEPLPLDDTTTQRNEFGLWHVTGNVREWVDGVADGNERATRGGSYADDADDLRLSSRHTMPATNRDAMTGFRIVREL